MRSVRKKKLDPSFHASPGPTEMIRDKPAPREGGRGQGRAGPARGHFQPGPTGCRSPPPHTLCGAL